MAQTGPNNDLTDVTGLQVGQAEDEGARTGVTVVLCEAPASAAVDVRGGGPGTRETDALAAGRLVHAVDALVLSGGSVYGLAAADGVCAALGEAGRGFALADAPGVPASPIVPAAILYDLANGGEKAWGVEPPYRALGIEALRRADGPVAQGRAGAGYGARAGAHSGGTGSASIVSSDDLVVAALACVNCFGSVTLPGQDEVYWAWPFEQVGEFGGARPDAQQAFEPEDWGAAKAQGRVRQNTSLAVVATDAALSKDQLQRLAVMAQDGFARAIRPVHAPFDGDVVFALSTGRKPLPEPIDFSLARIGALGADTLARAVARGVYEARRQTPAGA